MKRKLILALITTVCMGTLAQAAVLSTYEATISAPADSGTGPALWYKNADSISGVNVLNSGSAASTDPSYHRADRLGAETYTDFFGNTDMAFGINTDNESARVSYSVNEFINGSAGTISTLFKTPDTLQQASLFRDSSALFEVYLLEANARLLVDEQYINLPSLSADTWYYLAVKWDTAVGADNLTWYMGEAGDADSLSSGQATIDGIGTTGAIEVGGRTSYAKFSGAMQEFAVYERELSDASIRSQFNATITVPEPTTIGMMGLAATFAEGSELNVAAKSAGVYDDNASGIEVDPAAVAKPMTESKEGFDARMAWFREARFGLLLHFGVYAIPAEGEWHMRWKKMPVAHYKEYAKQFNPTNFNARAWAKLFKAAGVKYVVITAKHHDGFAMWPSKASDWNIADATPYGKDLIGPLAEACREEGLRFGLYYSHAQDWVNPGGAPGGGKAKPWDPAQEGDYDEYIDKIAAPQLKELAAYNPEILWFDTPVNITKDRAARLLAPLQSLTNIIINGRLGALRGDFGAAENMLPTYPKPGYWEACMTMGTKWCYAPKMDKLKSSKELIKLLAETVSKNGNLALGFGPGPDGAFLPEQIERLLAMGAWLERNGEAIYGAKDGPFPYLSYGRATRKGDQLNLIVFDWPTDGLLRVPLLSGVKGVRLAGTTEELKFSQDEQRLTIKVSAQAPDPVASVVVLELDGEPVARPVANAFATVKASHNDKGAANLVSVKDGGRSWAAPEGTTTATLEFSFEHPVLISTVRLEERDKWPRILQDYILETKVDGEWKKLVEGTTGGHGIDLEFEPVTTSALKLTLTGNDGAPGMSRVLFITPE